MTVMRIAMILRHKLIRRVSIDSPSSSPTPMFSMPVRICAIVESISILVLPWMTPAAPETTFCPMSNTAITMSNVCVTR